MRGVYVLLHLFGLDGPPPALNSCAQCGRRWVQPARCAIPPDALPVDQLPQTECMAVPVVLRWQSVSKRSKCSSSSCRRTTSVGGRMSRVATGRRRRKSCATSSLSPSLAVPLLPHTEVSSRHLLTSAHLQWPRVGGTGAILRCSCRIRTYPRCLAPVRSHPAAAALIVAPQRTHPRTSFVRVL